MVFQQPISPYPLLGSIFLTYSMASHSNYWLSGNYEYKYTCMSVTSPYVLGPRYIVVCSLLELWWTDQMWYMIADQINALLTCVVCWYSLQTVKIQIRPARTSSMVWIQTVWHSDSIPEIFFEKVDSKNISRRQKYEKLSSRQRVNNLQRVHL